MHLLGEFIAPPIACARTVTSLAPDMLAICDANPERAAQLLDAEFGQSRPLGDRRAAWSSIKRPLSGR
jgi:hypothetical protein